MGQHMSNVDLCIYYSILWGSCTDFPHLLLSVYAFMSLFSMLHKGRGCLKRPLKNDLCATGRFSCFNIAAVSEVQDIKMVWKRLDYKPPHQHSGRLNPLLNICHALKTCSWCLILWAARAICSLGGGGLVAWSTGVCLSICLRLYLPRLDIHQL